MRVAIATVATVVVGLVVSWAVLVVETVRRQPVGVFYE